MATAVGAITGASCVCKHHRRAQVHVKRAVDFARGERFERARRRETGVRDQDVDVAGFVGQSFDVVWLRQVDDNVRPP